ncbi:electron transfer flavoprotein subunit beta/FixA family protein [Candidatus Thalassolituus haligoni]|uniref:electron transfer flavoprotein subunit beta/FixA family protein n=1 Tax=Candidatus Thalassolituus haligoni TaxID=3100113 RepID=UPI0035136244|tara:strand:- start:23819 stop:24568 length:750 start_codon:yes stop_codon:yes gene_type:complete
MKILVCIKRVVDHNVKVRVKADSSGVDLTNVKMAINPFCEIAVEEAVRLKEAGIASEVVVVSVGPDVVQEQLRLALALGADRGIQVNTDAVAEPLNIAKLLAALMKSEEPGLVILGKQSIDADNNQTGQMLAALTGRPQGTFASVVKVNGSKVQVTREIDGGLRTVELALPAVVTTDLRLNEPRYAKLPDVMRAKKKSMAVVTPEELGVELKQHALVLSVDSPEARQAGIKVASVDELVDKLKNEAKVI